MKQACIYIMASKKNGTLYTGVTTNLTKRVYEHKNNYFPGFTQKYNCKQLVYYELCSCIKQALEREKQIKAGSKKEKLKLIEELNPEWRDLYSEIITY